MIVRNNYDECLTNLACSIRKYFGLEYHHGTLSYIDELLEKEHPKNVVVALFDGMGSRIMRRALAPDSFFLKHLKKEITTVFPATTTAATTSIRTGLNPVEHGWLGWNTYIEPIDKTITLFKNSEKGREGVICDDFLDIKHMLARRTIVDEINDDTDFRATELYPFGPKAYIGLDDLMERIERETKKTGRKYIYVYDDEPDCTMHDRGPDSNDAYELIRERDDRIAELCSKLKDTLVIVTADHGHKKAENIFLNNYPDLLAMLERTTSIEQRAVSFKIKDGLLSDFRRKFEEHFGDDFILYDKEEVMKSGLFGDGTPNILFEPALGDFIAIAHNSNKCLVSDGDNALVSQHAGYSDDEIMVPLIMVVCPPSDPAQSLSR